MSILSGKETGTPNEDLNTHHVFYIHKIPQPCHYNGARKSDMYIPPHSQLSYTFQNKAISAPCSVKNEHTGYYKRHEHDEIPVKDNASYVIHADDKNGDYCCLTDSHLNRLETRVFNDVSRELPTCSSSRNILESNIIFLKTTIQEIFDNFHTSMRDYDLYKQKFNEIFSKNQADSIADMEDFIKDMMQHIMSSETSLDESELTDNVNTGDGPIVSNPHSSSNSDSAILLQSLHSVVEAYKNDNCLTDSSADNMKTNKCSRNEETFNIFHLRDLPCVEIRMNDRQLLSEINIKNPSADEMSGNVASAENIKKLATKKLELENYTRQQQELPDREIPVKVSHPKKNIHLNEDFGCEKEVCEKSIICKICSFFCKKLRKY